MIQSVSISPTLPDKTEPPMEQSLNQPVLSVDLDGTLIHSDLLIESFLLLIKKNLLYIFLVPIWLLKGKARLKAEISQRIILDAGNLPYNTSLIDWLKEQKNSGREIWLCTASNYRLAHSVADHLNIFNGVLASDDQTNLSGQAKAEALVSKFGMNNFDYCGNSKADLKVWKFSRGAIVVNGSTRLYTKAKMSTDVVGVFNSPHYNLAALVKALRLHQWVKNILVFVPVFTAHKLNDHSAIYSSLLAFFIFGLCASSVYLLNDMLDLEADRAHPQKRKRPFAAGTLSLHTGIFLIPCLIFCAGALSVFLPIEFFITIAIYYLLTCAYTFCLKKQVLIDTITLAGLYTLRIIAGATALNVPLSFWLLLFSIFLFFSLAIVKRFTELHALQQQGKLNAQGRGYHTEDLPILRSVGTSSGMMCVLVFALYLNSPAMNSLYGSPEFLWPLCVILLFWISRVWLKAHRGELHDDPIVFALKDRVSIVCGIITIISIFAAM